MAIWILTGVNLMLTITVILAARHVGASIRKLNTAFAQFQDYINAVRREFREAQQR